MLTDAADCCVKYLETKGWMEMLMKSHVALAERGGVNDRISWHVRGNGDFPGGRSQELKL
jgi:hypothetical protein